MLVRWKDGTESWVKLSEMKESHPVEVAEFARSRDIHTEAAFTWWVPYTLQKREVILAAVKNQIRKKTHKYGIEILHVDHTPGDTQPLHKRSHPCMQI